MALVKKLPPAPAPQGFDEMRDRLVELYRHQITVRDDKDKVTVFFREEGGGLHDKQFAPGAGCMSAIRQWISDEFGEVEE